MATRPCPQCQRPLVEIALAVDDIDLRMRSCSRCDRRWWRRGEEDADLDTVLGVYAASSGR